MHSLKKIDNKFCHNMSRRYKHFAKKNFCRKCKNEFSFNNTFHIYLKKCTTKKRDVTNTIKKNVVVALKIQIMNAINFVNEIIISFLILFFITSNKVVCDVVKKR